MKKERKTKKGKLARQEAFRALGGQERLGCVELRKLAKFTGEKVLVCQALARHILH